MKQKVENRRKTESNFDQNIESNIDQNIESALKIAMTRKFAQKTCIMQASCVKN